VLVMDILVHTANEKCQGSNQHHAFFVNTFVAFEFSCVSYTMFSFHLEFFLMKNLWFIFN
jgi:hypothetical protein